MSAPCKGVTATGRPCQNKAHIEFDFHFCRIHGVARDEVRCVHLLANGTRCRRTWRREWRRQRLCDIHYQDALRLHEALEYNEEVRRFLELVIVATGNGVPDRVARIFAGVGARDFIEQRRYHTDLDALRIELAEEVALRAIEFAERERHGGIRLEYEADAWRGSELARLANDKQSVHTKIINEKTEQGIETILKTPVPSTQETLRDIAYFMFSKGYDALSRKAILSDSKQWYETSLCRTPDDYLYKKVLDHTWAKIVALKNEELKKRLIEEMNESVGMCCDGHLSRLANVFVGFTDDIEAPVSSGDILQTEMARISHIEDEEVRMREGRDLIMRLGIPDETARPWLEALV